MWVSFVTMVDCLWRWRVQESPVPTSMAASAHTSDDEGGNMRSRPLSNPKGMWQWLRLPWSSHEHVEGSQRSDTVKKLGCCRTVQVDRLWHNSLFGLWRTKSETRPDCDLSYIVLRLQQINTVSYTLCLRFEKFFSVQKYFKNKQKKTFFFS